MKAVKVLKSIIIILLVLIILIVAIVHFAGDKALKAGIETAASKALGVDVSVGNVSLSILAGKLELKNLVISNPEGYQHPEMLKIGHGLIDVSIGSLLDDPVKIETIKFDQIDMVLEQKGLTNNLKEVISALPSEEKTKEVSDKKSKNLVISSLEISDVTVKAKLLPVPGKADTVTIKVAPIKMTNLGTKNKLDTAKLTGKILAAIAAGIAKQGADLLPKDMVGSIDSALDNIGGDVLEKGQKATEKILESGKEIGEDVGGALKGLLKK
ncbi:MAG: AsmA family protein [Sedimentisphaerales bacterium]|nr:AsmA family protein [Sedimentisphaerales bacterium]